MKTPLFLSEDQIDFESDKQQEIYDLIQEDDEEVDYPEYDDIPSTF